MSISHNYIFYHNYNAMHGTTLNNIKVKLDESCHCGLDLAILSGENMYVHYR